MYYIRVKNKIWYFHNMSKEKKEELLSNDIKDWQFKDKLVLFEEFRSTLKRSESDFLELEDDENEDDEGDLPIQLKQLSFVQGHQMPQVTQHPEFIEPEKHFKLWTLHTKVPLTTRLLFKIENTDGIESIQALSKYRARIGIAPLFRDGIVMGQIQNLIHNSLKSDVEDLLSE